jgi:hypothetical protein
MILDYVLLKAGDIQLQLGFEEFIMYRLDRPHRSSLQGVFSLPLTHCHVALQFGVIFATFLPCNLYIFLSCLPTRSDLFTYIIKITFHAHFNFVPTAFISGCLWWPTPIYEHFFPLYKRTQKEANFHDIVSLEGKGIVQFTTPAQYAYKYCTKDIFLKSDRKEGKVNKEIQHNKHVLDFNQTLIFYTPVFLFGSD